MARRPQVRLRTVLILTAIVAVLLAAELARRQILEYRLLSELYQSDVKYHTGMAAANREGVRIMTEQAEKVQAQADSAANEKNQDRYSGAFHDELLRQVASCRAHAEWRAKLALHHEALATKYKRAVGRPWESVAPDPPEPSEPTEPVSGFLRVPPE
jgi:hypothetical protein